MDKGTYCLIFRNSGCTVRVGALGPVAFLDGWHIYIGSALGSGGLARLDRHISLARDRDKRPKWHVDYLLLDDHFSLRYAVYAPMEERLECRLTRALGNPGIPSFGCSDCRCPSHLLYRERDPYDEISTAFSSLGLVPVTKTIMNREGSKGNL
jgi:Uri superfamily endonuclease